MKKSYKFLFFGAGPNQHNFIKHSIKKKKLQYSHSQ